MGLKRRGGLKEETQESFHISSENASNQRATQEF